MIENLISWICLFAYLSTKNIAFLYACGILAISANVFNLWRILEQIRDKIKDL